MSIKREKEEANEISEEIIVKKTQLFQSAHTFQGQCIFSFNKVSETFMHSLSFRKLTKADDVEKFCQ